MSRIMGFVHDRIVAAGHEVDYFCADDVPESWAGAWGRRVAFPMAIRSRVLSAERSGRPYDIVNVHEPSAAPVVVSRRGTRPAVIVTSHGLERRAWELAKAEARLGRIGPAWRTRLTYPASSLWPSEAALRLADHVFCLNDEDRNHLICKLGRSATSVTRIFPGADDLYARAAARRDYARGRRILFAGTWRKNKGVEDLVPAFTALATREPEMVLEVVGAGVPPDYVWAQFPDGLRHRVRVSTPPDEIAMANAFASADLFLLPSLFEGTPLTLMQAMMSGLPIVTTATCGMKDVIDDRRTGLLVPIRTPEAIVTAIAALAADRSRRAELGRAAKAVAVERYGWPQAADVVLHAYEAVNRQHISRRSLRDSVRPWRLPAPFSSIGPKRP